MVTKQSDNAKLSVSIQKTNTKIMKQARKMKQSAKNFLKHLPQNTKAYRREISDFYNTVIELNAARGLQSKEKKIRGYLENITDEKRANKFINKKDSQTTKSIIDKIKAEKKHADKIHVKAKEALELEKFQSESGQNDSYVQEIAFETQGRGLLFSRASRNQNPQYDDSIDTHDLDSLPSPS
jgi:hypothetical protein